MAQALYRKYRPQSFDDLVGQNPIKVTLKNEIESGRIGHAYLFSGPRGIGKTTTARLLAKAVNCSGNNGAEPCGTCDFCKEITSGRLLDLIEIDAASHTGVDNVRENIIENARFTPQRAKYKVFIIDEVHMLSVSAFNALLKTLEEPPEHVIFILATTEIHRVPETIISRCQRFDFRRVSVTDLVSRLMIIAKSEKISVDESILQTIARRADGSVRDAEVLLGQIISLGKKNITEEEASLVIPRSNLNTIVELFGYIVGKDSKAGLALVKQLVDEGVSIPDFTKDFIEFLRTVLLYKVSGTYDEISVQEIGEDLMKDVKRYADTITVSRLIEIVETISIKPQELQYAQIVQLPLEIAIVDLCVDSSVDQASPRIVVQTKKPSGSAAPIAKKQPAVKKEEKPMEKQPAVKNELPIDSQDSNFSTLQNMWPKIVSKLNTHNRSIGVSMKVAVPVSLNDSELTIGFQYEFHAERIKDRSVRNIVEDTIKDAIGADIKLKVIVLSREEYIKYSGVQTTPQADTAQDGTWKQALDVLGGEITEEE